MLTLTSTILLISAAQFAQVTQGDENRPAHGGSFILRPSEQPDQRPALPLAGPLTAPALRGDARLTAVCSAGSANVWAVGDRGVIWHTSDAGRSWQLQESGTAALLGGVSFASEQDGLVTGGAAHPYLHTTAGVVLRTRDGGRRWEPQSQLLLPALGPVGFATPREGWAIGCASAMFPSGLFTTRDRGRNWSPCGGASASDWLAGDFLDPRNGLLCGARGAVALVQYGETETHALGGFQLRGLRGVKLAASGQGWLVGDGGLVMTTTDAGRNWRTPLGNVPPEMNALFDFRAVAMRGRKCWIAGTPGTRVLRSTDGGRNWTVAPTGSNVPIEALTMADDQHGWAVGPLGIILATDDGGDSWHLQHGNRRAALMAMYADPQEIPLELLARACGNDGYLGVIEQLGRRDLETQPWDEPSAAVRAAEAVAAVGGGAVEHAWRFPLRQAGLPLERAQIVAGWDAAANGHALDELTLYLVREIRVWRPDVVVLPDGSAGPLAALINACTREAIVKAADAAALAPLMTFAGLEPWRVKKVFTVASERARGALEIATAQWLPRWGHSLAEVADGPRALLIDRPQPVPPAVAFRLLTMELDGQPGTTPGRGDLFAGVGLTPGSDARRPLGDGAAATADVLPHAAQRRRHVEAILARSQQDPQAALRLLAETDELTRGLDPADAAGILYRLADHYYRSGRWDMASETYQLLVDRYGNDLHCRPALVWLLQYYASSAAMARGNVVGGESARGSDRLARVAAVGQVLERTRPDLYAEPCVRFPLAAAYRKLGQTRLAEMLYRSARQGTDRFGFSACAEGELWLLDRKGPPPRPLATCAIARQRPKLDGNLDKPLWREVKPLTLQSALHDDAQWPAAVMLACDDQYLYVGVNCRMAPGAKYDATAAPRQRDADLTEHDRVDILLDVDRDYATSYRLTIDHRGWAADSCWGDASWNPQWFVAARAADGCWTAEAAIPLRELRGRQASGPPHQQVWALGLQRTVPGVGFQSWSTPAAVAVAPQGFGWLEFP
jgi:photosystem II stability/assembly factor-like uncharacterized protein